MFPTIMPVVITITIVTIAVTIAAAINNVKVTSYLKVNGVITALAVRSTNFSHFTYLTVIFTVTAAITITTDLYRYFDVAFQSFIIIIIFRYRLINFS